MTNAITKAAPSGFYISKMCGGLLLQKRPTAQPVPANENKERTPAEHRAEVAAWRAHAEKHDHKIFPRKQATEKARHRSLAGLGALLTFRNRPDGVAEGVPTEEAATIRTNWKLTPANDNQPPDDGFGSERAVEYEPTLDLLEREIEDLPMAYRQEPMMLRMVDGSKADRLRSREVHGIPYGDDVEYGIHVDENGKSHNVIVRIGRLKFSDGTQTERGHKLAMDQVVEADLKLPVGAMLSSREKSTRDKGSEDDNTGSNAHYRWMVSGRVAMPPKQNRKKGERLEVSKAEAWQMLADAIANTSAMPEVIKCPHGFPYGPTNLRQLFIGGRKGKKGESGSQAWQDIFTENENRAQFNRALDSMADENVRLLTEAVTAKSLREIGERRGFQGRHAVDAGRRLLIAANDNFDEAMGLAEYAAEA